MKSLEEIRERVRAKRGDALPGEWILGGGWDETLWPVKVTPNRWDLDEVSNGHPVFLDRVDGHIAVANTRALQLASITLASRDPEGGQIDRDTNGQPTGILRETAQQAVVVVIPKPSHDQRGKRVSNLRLPTWPSTASLPRRIFRRPGRIFKIYEELEKEGKLTARISGMAALRRFGRCTNPETRLPSPV